MDEHMTTPVDLHGCYPRRRAGDVMIAAWRRFIRVVRALDDHWIGDLIGVASLFATLWVALVAGWVLQ